jgi:tripartite motif-containing protein 71
VGSYGTGNGQFKNPSGVATDSAGNVYLADSGNHRIQKFGPSGNFIAKWGSFGSANGQFNSPQSVATDATNVYVADSGNHRVQKFSPGGGFVAKWGSSGSGDGHFNQPASIAAQTNTVLVADRGNHRIQAFVAPDGGFLAKWGTFGSSSGQFKNPSGIATDRGGSSNDLYVADFGNHRIQKFRPRPGFTTDFITGWGRNGGDGSSGSGDGQFNGPRGVATDQFDNVYVADSGNHWIQKFNPVQ